MNHLGFPPIFKNPFSTPLLLRQSLLRLLRKQPVLQPHKNHNRVLSGREKKKRVEEKLQWMKKVMSLWKNRLTKTKQMEKIAFIHRTIWLAQDPPRPIPSFLGHVNIWMGSKLGLKKKPFHIWLSLLICMNHKLTRNVETDTVAHHPKPQHYVLLCRWCLVASNTFHRICGQTRVDEIHGCSCYRMVLFSR